jgi:hypothetical protein
MITFKQNRSPIAKNNTNHLSVYMRINLHNIGCMAQHCATNIQNSGTDK